MHNTITPLPSHTWRLPLIAALMAASLASPALAAPNTAQIKAQPQLVEVARTHPERRVAVIVQKSNKTDAAATLVHRLGGRVTMSLDIINAFAAELPAKAVLALAQSGSVRWVSPDGQMVHSSWNGDSTQPEQAGYQVAITNTETAPVNDGLKTMALQTQPIVQVGLNGASVVVPVLPVEAGRMSADGEIVPAQPLKDLPAPAIEVGQDQKRYEAGNSAHWIDTTALKNVYQSTVRATNAWNNGYTGSGMGVAVLDSGITVGFEDFNDNYAQTRVLATVNYDVDNNADLSCSRGVGASQVVTFVNSSSRPAMLYWRDSACAEVNYGTLAPNGAIAQPTFAEHMWVVRDADTNAVLKTHKASGNATVSFGDLALNDPFGHGTHVAGIAAGSGRRSNKMAYAGTAPNSDLINVRVIKNDGSTRASNVVAGMQWILQNKARYNIRVVNISLNSAEYESYHTNPLCAAAEVLWFNGIVVVVSAGNRGGGNLFPPANDPFVITVGATDDKGTVTRTDDTLASFSAYGVADGVSKPDLVAPGRYIKAPMPNSTLVRDGRAQNVAPDYYSMSGTSMAAPVVAGAVAILLGKEPWLTPDQVKFRLKQTATPFLTPSVAGAGLLDVYNALYTNTGESANVGSPMSKLLTGGSTKLWTSVSWSSVSWSSVSWSSVSWSSIYIKP